MDFSLKRHIEYSAGIMLLEARYISCDGNALKEGTHISRKKKTMYYRSVVLLNIYTLYLIEKKNPVQLFVVFYHHNYVWPIL